MVKKSNTGSVSDAFRRQRFDTVGWVSEHPACKKLSDEVLSAVR